MAKLKIWFLDVGHGDCAYIELPNGGRMMVDCGGGNNGWPSKLLKFYKITKNDNPIPMGRFGIDNLLISHPHGDHISDIMAIHDDIGFYSLTGAYGDFIDDVGIDAIDYRKRGQDAARKFIEIVKKYKGRYDINLDRVAGAAPLCTVISKRLIPYQNSIDLNDISWLTSFEIGGHKVLFTGDMTSAGVNKILRSSKANEFKGLVKGTTVLKVPHHGRENGCSQEMLDLFGTKPLICILSDEILNEKNEGTSNTKFYTDNSSDKKIKINGSYENRKVLSTRKDKDILLEISDDGTIHVMTDALRECRDHIKIEQ